ncbi:MAG: nuclease domain-containing protein, partial [Paramarteilia canceri]
MKFYEDYASNAKLGIWSPNVSCKRKKIDWVFEDLSFFIKQETKVPVVIEKILDSNFYRVLHIHENFYWRYFLVQLVGIKTGPKSTEWGLSAKNMLEHTFLQRDATLNVHSQVDNQFNIDIAQNLLENGLGTVEYSQYLDQKVSLEYMKSYEIAAKAGKTKTTLQKYNSDNRIFNGNHNGTLSLLDKYFTAKVKEIGAGDSLIIQNPKDGQIKRIFFSSTIFSKKQESKQKQIQIANPNKVYTIPFLFEAREYLRKHTLGKTLSFTVDYIVAGSEYIPERICCTVYLEGRNIGCELIEKGFALCMKHKKDDNKKSSELLLLQKAEENAIKKSIGLHSNVLSTTYTSCVDISHSVTLVKPYLFELQSLKKASVIVESVYNSVKMKIYVKALNVLVSLTLACVYGPRYNQKNREYNEKFTDSLNFMKELCFQKDCEAEFDTLDRGGNLIGNLFVNNQDLSIKLVENGYANINWDVIRCPTTDDRIIKLKDAENKYK